MSNTTISPDNDNLSKVNRLKMISWLINALEGFKAKPYNDIAGHATIGYGHEIIKSVEEDPGLQSLHLSAQKINEGLTEGEGQTLLLYDLSNRANIDKIIEKPLSDPLWAALTSFCFNIGENHFQHSDVCSFLKSNELHEAADSMASWRSAEGKFAEGIAKRRLCEIVIFLDKPLDSKSALPASQQFKAPCKMPFTDDNWTRLSLAHKQDVSAFYKAFKEKFPI